MRNRGKTPSNTSPRGGKRACLCSDGTYSIKCCDGSLWAQGIGNVTGKPSFFLAQEDGNLILQEDNYKIKT
jgi:hypothetical protein